MLLNEMWQLDSRDSLKVLLPAIRRPIFDDFVNKGARKRRNDFSPFVS